MTEKSTLHISIKVIPRAGAIEIRGRMADGTVKIALKASPTDGKANKELIKFLAGEFGTRSSSVRLLSGAASRKKLVAIDSFSRIPEWFNSGSNLYS
jgi:uncharacterized protein (TIGR00251 family)